MTVSQRAPRGLREWSRSPQQLLSADPKFPESAGALAETPGGYGPAPQAPVRVVHDGRARSAEQIDEANAAATAEAERLAPMIENLERAAEPIPTAELVYQFRRIAALRNARLT